MDLANSSLQPDNKRISQLLIPTDNLKDFNGRQHIMVCAWVFSNSTETVSVCVVCVRVSIES